MLFSIPDAELLGTSPSKWDKTNPNKTRNKGNFPPALTTSITKKLITRPKRENRPNRGPILFPTMRHHVSRHGHIENASRTSRTLFCFLSVKDFH